ncbi:MAG: helix-turn-helix transcriptional regulator [Spirochaetes bacterium]|nr:helix-turn-helix transcriptional regulator [Spirochaetota bacterium]
MALPKPCAPLELFWLARVHYPPAYTLVTHRHRDFSQIFFVLEGSGSFTLGKRIERFSPGFLFYAGEGVPHGLSAAKKARAVTLEAKFKVHDRSLARALPKAEGAFSDEGDSWRLLLESIVQEGIRGEAYHREIATARLTELHWLLARARAPHRTAPAADPKPFPAPAPVRVRSVGPRAAALSTVFDPATRRAVEFIEATYREPLSLAAIAAAAGVSPRHLSGRFRNVTGETVAAWLWRWRVEQAKARMLSGEDSLEAIALHGGFETVHHFSRIFKRQEGIPPGKWRDLERDQISRGVVFGGFDPPKSSFIPKIDKRPKAARPGG